MTAKKKSAADRKAEMEALHAQLAEQVEQLRSSEQWARYLEFCRSFHRYSIGNLLLIFAQAPEATQVAGYRTWQKLGRQVRKGEHGIRIIGTGTKKVESEDDETGEVVEGKRRVFFPVSVFDQAQTDLMEGREDVSEVAHKLEGEDAAGICDEVAAHLMSSGVIVKRENITNGANGYTRKQDDGSTLVVVDDRHSPAQAEDDASRGRTHHARSHRGRLLGVRGPPRALRGRGRERRLRRRRPARTGHQRVQHRLRGRMGDEGRSRCAQGDCRTKSWPHHTRWPRRYSPRQ